MSVYWDILYQVQAQIRSQVDLTGVNDIPAIPDAAVVIRRQQTGTDSHDWYHDEAKPGIVISPSRVINIPPDGGDNCDDDVWYPVMLQIIDNDSERANEDRIKAWTKWLENLRKYFSCGNLRNEVFTSAGYVDLVLVDQIALLDERQYVMSRYCVFALALRVKSRESHDPNGRV